MPERQVFFNARDLDAVEGWVQQQPAYASLTFAPQPETLLRDVFLDTPDWALYRAGLSLCICHGPHGAVARLKPRRGVEQAEMIQALDDYTKEQGESIRSVAGKVRLLAGSAVLRTIFEAETRRRTFLIEQDGAALAVLNLDATEVRLPDGEVHELSRAEIEAVAQGAGLKLLADALQAACDLTPTGDSRFQEALSVSGILPEATFDFGYAQPSPGASTGEFAFASLRRYFSAVLTHEPGTRLGEDTEELHRMRVAVRRLRSAIRVFMPVLPLRFSALRDELKWVSSALGGVRDLDVRHAWLMQLRDDSGWEEAAAIGPLLEDIQQLRADARQRLLSALSSERYQDLVVKMTTALRSGESSVPESALPVRDFAQLALRKPYRRFRREVAQLGPNSEVAAYHQVRISVKRLRYGLDCFTPIFDRQAKRLLQATGQAQDLLGEHQDCAVAVAWLRESAAARGIAYPPATLLRMGELIERRSARMIEIRRQCPDAFGKVKKAWRALRESLRPASGEAASREETPDRLDE